MEGGNIKRLIKNFLKKKIIGIEEDYRYNDLNGKISRLDWVTPRKLQIIALLTFIGNLILILALGFKAVQFYAIIIGFFSISQIFLSSYLYKAPNSDKNYYPYVTIIIPAYNEEDTIVKTLESCLESGYPFDELEVITVNDGSTDLDNEGRSRTLTLMYETRDKLLKEKGFEIQVLDLGKNFGKREAMIRGFLSASKKTEIFITVDADSYVQKGAISKIIQPFKDKNVGAVSGNTQISNLNKLLTKIQNYMYWVSFTVFKSSESLFGTVLCCPGCFSAFRSNDVIEVLPNFRNETFCRVSEDRNLTNLILEKGKEILYHHEAIAKTNAPEKLSQFIKQQYRWKISTIYENIFVATRFINSKHPFIVFNFYVSFILIFSWGIAAMYALFTQIIGGATPWTVLFWLTCMPVFPIYWALKEKKIENFSYGFLSLYLWIFIIDHLNYFAFANLRTEKWGGKENTEKGADKSLIKRIINKSLIPFNLLFSSMKKVSIYLPEIRSKYISKLQPTLITIGVLVLIASAYYVNLRLPMTDIFAYAPTILYFISQSLYMGISHFFSQYWLGIIGMVIFGMFGAKIIQKIGSKDKNSKSLTEITKEMYPELTNKEHKEIMKNSTPILSETILHQNDTIASPLFLLLNMPYIRKYLAAAIKTWEGNLLIKPVAWIIEIFTMLILYRFFLRHFLLPINLSSKRLTSIIGEKEVKKILSNVKRDSGKEREKKISRKIKRFFTLESFLTYFDSKIIKWNSKRDYRSAFWSIPLVFAILVRAFASLLRQRLVIAFIALYIATPVAYLLFSTEMLNTTLIYLPIPFSGLFPVTLSLIITSFIVVLFLELFRMKSVWIENRKKYNKKKAFINWIIASSIFLLGGTISMVLIGPELIFAIQITAGIPLLGDTVRFMEDFIYGANGQGGIGEKILLSIQNQTGIINSDPIKDGWAKPKAWKIEKDGRGVMPEPQSSLKIDGQGEAFSHLIKVDSTQNYVLQSMVDTESKMGSIDISIEEFHLKGKKATLINRIYCGGVDSEQGIEYITTRYKPSSSEVNALRISIEGNDNKNIKGYVDGIRLSRVNNSPATNELKKPHIILRFDDGWKNQATQEMKTNKYGYPAVYNIIPNVLPDEMTDSSKNSQYMSLQEIYKLFNQNQIGTHSEGYKDDNINNASQEKILKETFYNYQIFKILGFKSDIYASPNFLYNSDSLKIIYRNFYSHQIEDNTNLNAYKFPFNRYNLYTVEPVQVKKEVKSDGTVFYDPGLMDIEETKRFIDSAVKNNATPVFMFHVINKAGDHPKTKLEMETTAYNEILDYIHAKKIPVITFDQLLALQEESLSDLPLNSFDGNGIKSEEGFYYPMGSVQLFQGDGDILQDYFTSEDIQSLNIPPDLAQNEFLNNALQTYGKAQVNPQVSSPNVGIIPLAAAVGIVILSKKGYRVKRGRTVKKLKIKFKIKKVESKTKFKYYSYAS